LSVQPDVSIKIDNTANITMVTLKLNTCKLNHTREHFQPRPDLRNVVQM